MRGFPTWRLRVLSWTLHTAGGGLLPDQSAATAGQSIRRCVAIYTVTDETYYVGLGPGRYQSRYGGGKREEVVGRVEADGWQPSGRCVRSDGVAVNMWSRGYREFGAPAELIAIWDETSQPVST